MAIGTSADFKIHQEQVQGGFIENIMQMYDAFNAESKGAITLQTTQKKGDYEYETFFLEGADVGRRNPDDITTDLTDNVVAQDEEVRVKLHRNFTRAMTRNQWLRIGKDPEVLSFLYGQQLAPRVMREQLDRSLAALAGALSVSAHDLEYDYTGTGTLTHAALNSGLAKAGDSADGIVALVMHSKAWFDLMGDAIANMKFDSGAGITIREGVTGTFNRPVIITDSASLVVAGTTPNYITLGLRENAARVEDTEPPFTADELVTGKVNLYRRLQTEYAYNLGLKGIAYDVANGGKNPTNAAVATATNWDKVATDVKSLPGVRILTL